MSFIGKETFREGNIWLEEGAIAGLPFSPYLYAYQEDGGTYTKVDAPPVPVSAEFTTWFGFTYQVSLPETFTSADGDPSQFSLTALDVTERGGAFIDYGDGNGPVPMGAPDDLVGFAKGTSDDYPDGSSVTWSVLDAQQNVIGERTIEFGSGGGGAGPNWTSAVYEQRNEGDFYRLDSRPATMSGNYGLLFAAGPAASWPASAPDLDTLKAGNVATTQQIIDAGAEWIGTYNVEGIGMSLTALVGLAPHYGDIPMLAAPPVEGKGSPFIFGVYHDQACTDPVWEDSIEFTP
jgi:hypothetical protein